MTNIHLFSEIHKQYAIYLQKNNIKYALKVIR